MRAGVLLLGATAKDGLLQLSLPLSGESGDRRGSDPVPGMGRHRSPQRRDLEVCAPHSMPDHPRLWVSYYGRCFLIGPRRSRTPWSHYLLLDHDTISFSTNC